MYVAMAVSEMLCSGVVAVVGGSGGGVGCLGRIVKRAVSRLKEVRRGCGLGAAG